MDMKLKHNARLLVLALSAALACTPALAEKPEWAGGKDKHEHKHKDKDKGKGGKHAHKGKHRDDVKVGAYFSDDQRQRARAYYTGQVEAGRCPPGLAKKNNGCLPPGQAKKYAVGQPLPAGVVYYPVPQPVLVQLPPAPAGHKYVRVAADILLIAIGTSMVVDAMTDLARL